MKNCYALFIFVVFFCYSDIFAQGITFAENKGQWNAEVLYKANIPGGDLYITSNGPVYNFASQDDLTDLHNKYHNDHNFDFSNEKVRHHAYRFQFIDALPTSTHFSVDKIPYYENFFIGNDAAKWAGKVEHFKKVVQKDIYKNTDVVYYTSGQSLKYDFIVRPGANVNAIKMKMDGANLRINENDAIEITTGFNTIIEKAPFAFQIINGDTIPVACKYTLHNETIGFEAAKFNSKFDLIIDPDIVFATYSGATSSSFYSYTSSYDNAGNTIIAALGFGTGWPTHMGAYDVTHNGATDVALMKISADGTTRMFATYIGGSGQDIPYSISTNTNNAVFVIGSTASQNFPVTAGAFQTVFNGGTNDIFIIKISNDGSILQASTFLGGDNFDGSTYFSSISYDNKSSSNLRYNKYDNTLWFTTSTLSPNFPTTSNALYNVHNNNGAVLAQMDTSLSQLLFSSFFNSNSDFFFHDFKFSNSNQMYLSGVTAATNIGTSAAFKPNFIGGTTDGFVMKINPTTKTILYSSYLGTDQTDNALKLAITPDNQKIYINGQTEGDYPTPAGAYSVAGSRNYIQILDSTLSNSITACKFGGTATLSTSDLYVQDCKAFGIAGMSYGNMPLTSTAYSTTGEFWLGNFNIDLTNLVYGTRYGYGGHTHIGTFEFDSAGNIHHSVCDVAGNFVTSNNAWSPTKQTTSFDMVSFKFDMSIIDHFLGFELAAGINDTGCAPHSVLFVNNSYNYTQYHWDFGNGTTSNLFHPSVQNLPSGLYNVVLTGTNPVCNLEDQDSLLIFVKDNVVIHPFVSDTTICAHIDNLTIQIDSVHTNALLGQYQIEWQPASAIQGNANGLSVQVDPKLSNNFNVTFHGLLNDTICYIDTTVAIQIHFYDSSHINVMPAFTSFCAGDSVVITASGGVEYTWNPETYLSPIINGKVLAKPENDITYLITIVDSQQCIYHRTSQIDVLEMDRVEAGQDIVIRRGEQAQLNGSTSANSYHWMYNQTIDYHNNLKPIVAPTETTLYYLISTSSEGCRNMDSVYVHVNDVKSPNAFTPNGDGRNDAFYPLPLNMHAEMIQFSVYNRFGQQVYYTQHLSHGWDGTFKGQVCDAGVYFYHVEYKIGSKTYYDKGDVTLIR